MGFSAIYGPSGELVFGLAAGGAEEKQPDNVCDANARLIREAPAIYAALAALVERHSDLVSSGDCGFWDAEDEDTMKIARAALARARGETP
jgi:hypothetical protein